MRIQLEHWQLDTETRELTGPDGPVRLRPQAFKTLCFLIDRAPAVVTKAELLDEVWDAQAVSDSAIAQVIRELRSIFGEDPSAPRMIATRHRLGYQWIAEVQVVDEAEPPVAVGPEPPASAAVDIDPPSERRVRRSTHPVSRRHPIGLGLGLGILLILALLILGIQLLPLTKSNESAARGWPVSAEAASHVQRGLEAVRRLDSANALAAFEEATKIETTPRLSIQKARLLARRGQVQEAQQLLSQLEAQRLTMNRRDQLFADAVRAESEGRLTETGRLFALIAETHPEDADFALAHWETDRKAEAAPLMKPPLADHIPLERRLLIDAQHAGRQNQTEEQLERAKMATRSASGPVLAAHARVEEGRALRSLGRVEDSLTALSEAAASLQELGELRSASRVLGLAVDNLAILRRTDELHPLLASYQSLVETLADPWEKARLAMLRGRLAAIEGDHARAAEHYSVAAERCEALEAWDLGATAVGNHAFSLQNLGRLGEAELELQKAVRWAEASTDPNLIGQASINLANYLSRRGDIERAIAHYDRALAQFRQSQYIRGEAAALVNLARVVRQQGKAERAIELNGAAGRLFREMDVARGEAVALFQSAEANLTLGQLDAAERLANEALALLRKTPGSNYDSQCLALLAQIALRSGDPQRAGTFLDPATLPDPQTVGARARVQIERARRARERGENAAARWLLNETLESITEPDDIAYALLFQLELARLDLEDQRAVRAEQTARKAMGIAERRGNLALKRDATLVLTEALLALGKLDAAEELLGTVQALLEEAPDFQSRLVFALLEARLEWFQGSRPKLTGNRIERQDLVRSSSERLQWILDTAIEHGHRLLALETRVEMARQSVLSPPEYLDLKQEIEDRGLGRLLQSLDASP